MSFGPEELFDVFEDDGPKQGGLPESTLVRILEKLSGSSRARDGADSGQLPADAELAWARGDLVDAVSLVCEATGLSIADATAALRDGLGEHPYLTLIERRVDELVTGTNAAKRRGD